MEKPKSLSWSLKHGYQIVCISGTDNYYCVIDVWTRNAPDGYLKECTFLQRSSWVAKMFPEYFYEFSLPR
jgi:hypothetical protein